MMDILIIMKVIRMQHPMEDWKWKRSSVWLSILLRHTGICLSDLETLSLLMFSVVSVCLYCWFKSDLLHCPSVWPPWQFQWSSLSFLSQVWSLVWDLLRCRASLPVWDGQSWLHEGMGQVHRQGNPWSVINVLMLFVLLYIFREGSVLLRQCLSLHLSLCAVVHPSMCRRPAAEGFRADRASAL